MLAQARLPVEYARWNRRWNAPFGTRWKRRIPADYRLWPLAANVAGYFAFQPNNDTRAFEYPWAFQACAPWPGMRVLEIGGGFAGLQFVLDRVGCHVVNVDPGQEARGKGWPIEPVTFRRLNRRFGTNVRLENCFIQDADLEPASFDRVLSISTLEHVPEPDIVAILERVREVLRPGGLFILTVDLFLDVEPFTDQPTNRYGKNISIKWLVEESGLELVFGDRRELYGYEAFDPEAVLARKDEYLVGGGYPAMVQTLVLRR